DNLGATNLEISNEIVAGIELLVGAGASEHVIRLVAIPWNMLEGEFCIPGIAKTGRPGVLQGSEGLCRIAGIGVVRIRRADGAGYRLRLRKEMSSVAGGVFVELRHGNVTPELGFEMVGVHQFCGGEQCSCGTILL